MRVAGKGEVVAIVPRLCGSNGLEKFQVRRDIRMRKCVQDGWEASVRWLLLTNQLVSSVQMSFAENAVRRQQTMSRRTPREVVKVRAGRQTSF